MIPYRCEWCGAALVAGEDMVSLSLSKVRKTPKRYGSVRQYFDSGEDEVLLHASCFRKASIKISEYLFPNGTEEPKRDAVEFAMLSAR